jgi:hypothetical protein
MAVHLGSRSIDKVQFGLLKGTMKEACKERTQLTLGVRSLPFF